MPRKNKNKKNNGAKDGDDDLGVVAKGTKG